MKKVFLIACILGFIAPNILVTQVSLETGNILLWLHPLATIRGMFANPIASIFVIDLLWAVLVFFYWTYTEVQRKSISFQRVQLIWFLTLLFGLAGAFPLFLYWRNDKS